MAEGADHFYTANMDEANYAIQHFDYQGEGIEGYVFTTPHLGKEVDLISRLIPVYRCYNGHTTDHFYTTDIKERDSALGMGYKDEGISFYVRPVHDPQLTNKHGLKWIALHRMFSGNDTDHFYTTAIDRSLPKAGGYVDEGILGYILSDLPHDPLYAAPLFRLYHRGHSHSKFPLGDIIKLFEVAGSLFGESLVTGAESLKDEHGNTVAAYISSTK